MPPQAASGEPGPQAPSGDRRLKLCFACSPGGHLAQLAQLRPFWEQHARFWFVIDRDDTRSFLRDETLIAPHHPTTRSLRNALRNLALAWKVLRRERPDVVISTGAGIAFPVFVAARLMRIPTVYIEVFGRVDLPTVSGRLCYPISTRFLLQWQEQRRFYPRGQYVGPLFPAPTATGVDEGAA